MSRDLPIAIGLSVVLTAAALAEPIERQRVQVSDGDTIRVDGIRMRLVEPVLVLPQFPGGRH